MLKLSLRARLLAGMGLVVITLVVVALIVTTTTRNHLIAQVDDRLAVAGGPRFPGPPRGGDGGDGGDGGLPTDRPSDFYFGTMDSSGRLTTNAGSDFAGEATPDVSLAQAEASADANGKPFTVDAKEDGGPRYRVAARHFGNGEIAIIAQPLTDVDDTVNRLLLVEVLATAIIVVVLGSVTWWVVRLGIRPIKQMTATAVRIADGDRTQRVPELSPATEAGELGGALNHMLGRLDDAFAQQTASEDRLRRFVADASHELRTPVTTIRGYAELYRVGGLADGDSLDEAMRRTEQEAIRMARLVEDLLNLAKLDEGRPLERRDVDLAALVNDAARDAAAVDPGRVITADAARPVVVHGDEDRLRQVIANVVGNAIVHTPPGTPIELRVVADDGTACIAVTDHGPGMPPEVAAKVTQRFYRADPSRARNRGGSGLGMSIADAAVSAHGGSIGVDSVVGLGTTVTVTLPRA
jgi:two-component system, OmpR family, sensor kinase